MTGQPRYTQTLPYDAVMARLDVPDVRTLEDLVIACMYSGLLEGKLNQKQRKVHVSSATGRDVRPDAIPDMLAALERWCAP